MAKRCPMCSLSTLQCTSQVKGPRCGHNSPASHSHLITTHNVLCVFICSWLCVHWCSYGC